MFFVVVGLEHSDCVLRLNSYDTCTHGPYTFYSTQIYHFLVLVQLFIQKKIKLVLIIQLLYCMKEASTHGIIGFSL